jgi:DNA/RNA endonuclease G (NUC1)
MCNVCPQTPKLNRGSWKKYESYGHRLAARYEFVTIVCGPIYYENKSYTYIGSKNNKIAVPDAFYKIFIADNEFVEAYIFKQDGSYEEATIDMIASLTSIGFSLTK